MSQSMDKGTILSVPNMPAGNVDVLRCDNGAIYVVGWAVFSATGNNLTKVFLCPKGKPRVELPVIQQSRADVNEHLGIPNDIVAGFSTLVSLGNFSIDELPSGVTSVVLVDSEGKKDDIYVGTVDIKWPEAFLSITPDMKRPERQEKVNKKPSMFKIIWRGELGNDPKMAALMGSAPLTAKAICNGSQLIEERPRLALSMSNMLVVHLAQRMRLASENRGLIIIFDHDFGGGANTFSKNLVTQHILGANEVLRVWYQPSEMKFVGSYIASDEQFSIDLGCANDVFRLCTEFPSFAVQVNSLWGYPQIREILDNLLRLRLYGFTERLEFFAHDHMGVCPSLFLLDQNHKYCGVPKSQTICNKCLKNNTQDFKIFFHEEDVDVWRSSWQSLFLNCDVIRFFSQSTAAHYICAYPWLDGHPNAIVIGHEVHDIWNQKVASRKVRKDGLNIGIFGFINAHKGSQVVWDIAKSINESGEKSCIYIFGSLDGVSIGTSGPIEVMGRYKPEQMVRLCDESDIDLVLVPSTCPETFSITTKELTLIGIPVVTFDLGAQMELVADYDKGHVLELESEMPVYDRLKTININRQDS